MRRKERRGERDALTAPSLERRCDLSESSSGGAATACGQLPNMVQEDGALQVIELRGVHGDLGEERVCHEDRRLVAMARVGVAQKRRDIDLKGPCETIEG